MMHRLGFAATIVALSFGAAACAGDEPAVAPSPDAGIATTLADFSIRPAETEAAAGSVTFDLVNEGPSDHAFALVRTDLAHDALPMEDHVLLLDDLEVVADAGEVPFDTERSLTVDLAPGAYVMVCTIRGHYESDMHTAFTVT
jgi:uncharacterized cupredoxin-like copper-binding protein